MEGFEPIFTDGISPLEGSSGLGLAGNNTISNPLVSNTQREGAMSSGLEDLTDFPILKVSDFDTTLDSNAILNFLSEDSVESDINTAASSGDPLLGNADNLSFVLDSNLFVATANDPVPQFDSGVFTVGDTGQVSIDFLFDGGKWRGELAMFSLSGMDAFEVGSTDFIKEAARRALTDSELGRIVISDKTEGARFSGVLGDHERKDWNAGEYQGVKTFAMNSGDELGFMLAPKGSIQKIFDNPHLSGSKQPWFSMMTESGSIDNFGRLVDITGDGKAFAFGDGYGDSDYNDLIFQIQGATGNTLSITMTLETTIQ